jgi:hypothetical protein
MVSAQIAKFTYPGVYSGIMTFFPNTENVYPMVAAAASDCAEASTICGRLKDGPDEGCFMMSEITITVAAIPIATATFARNEAPGVVDTTATASVISFASSPPGAGEGSALDTDAFAVRETKQDKLRKLYMFARNTKAFNGTITLQLTFSAKASPKSIRVG